MLVAPDVLVLAAGGVLGEAWMSGVLAGAEDAGGLDFRRCDAFLGTSAGAIVAARLAAGRRPRRPESGDGASAGLAGDVGAADAAGGSGGGGLGRVVRGGVRLGAWAAAPFVPPLLAAGAPAGARLRALALALARVPDRGEGLPRLHREMRDLRSRFDGRLRVCCVDRATGRRVVFGAPGAPDADVADAVVASCAIPWVFRPVRIGGREYVDGGAWSLTNLDAAPAGRDSEVLCLHPSLSLRTARRSALGAVRAAAAAAAQVEALALRARGARVRIVGPAPEAAELMGVSFMDPRPARAVHAAGYRQGRSLAG